MSDSDEYDKISDFEGDESVNGSVENIEAGNVVVTENVNENVNEDENESNDSYVYYNSEEEISPPPSIEPQTHGHSSDQTTNQKMKDLTIDDSTKVVEESAQTETKTPESSKKAVKPISNEFARFLEEDRKFELDTKLHEHITNLCFEARRVAANEYEKCADSFGAAKSSQFKYKQFPGVQKGWATKNSKKPEPTKEKSDTPPTDPQNPDATNDAYHKMFLDEQKYINLQIQLAETTDPNEKEMIDKQCKEAEMQWLNSKEEYERFCGESKSALAKKMDLTLSNEAVGKCATIEQHNDIITEKFFDVLDKQPQNPTTESSMPSNPKNSELYQKIQKAKVTMQSLAQNYSSLKLQMYQQRDKIKKAKYSKFCSQAEERWKNAKKEYEKLCKANQIDSIDPTVAEYRHLKHQLHDVKRQIQATAFNSDPSSKQATETVQQVTVVKTNESDAIMSSTEKESTATTLSPPATTVPNGKSDHEILLHAYNVTQDFKTHMQELCDQVTENRTIEFKQYFTNLMKNANDEYKKATQVYQSLLDKYESTVLEASTDTSKSDVPKTYYCKKCGNYLTKEKHTISTQFSGALGAATLFSAVENVEHGELAQRDMMTGRYFIKDVNCNICRQKLGWFYETAVDEKQKYKEGATVLENSLLQIKPITVAKETTMPEMGFTQKPLSAHLSQHMTFSSNLSKYLNAKSDTKMEVDAVPGSSKSTKTVKSEDQQFEKFILFLKVYEAGQKTQTQMPELLKVLCKQNPNIANSNEYQAFVHKILNEFCQKLNENEVQHSTKYKTAVQEALKLLEDKTKIESGLLRKREAMDTEDNIFHIMKHKRFKDGNEEDDNQQS